jgi:hypothetical protein
MRERGRERVRVREIEREGGKGREGWMDEKTRREREGERGIDEKKRRQRGEREGEKDNICVCTYI